MFSEQRGPLINQLTLTMHAISSMANKFVLNSQILTVK